METSSHKKNKRAPKVGFTLLATHLLEIQYFFYSLYFIFELSKMQHFFIFLDYFLKKRYPAFK